VRTARDVSVIGASGAPILGRLEGAFHATFARG